MPKREMKYPMTLVLVDSLNRCIRIYHEEIDNSIRSRSHRENAIARAITSGTHLRNFWVAR